MEAVTLILTLLFLACVVLGAYASVKAIGAAKRGVDRTIQQARRTVEDTALRAKSVGQPGVQGELAQLRLRLRTSMRATQDTLQTGAADDASLSESIGLFRRLSAHGHDLDEELRQLEREPDRARVLERLTELRERTARITRSADSLRWAARDRARRFAEDDLSALSDQIDVESGALRHWSSVEPPAGKEWPEASAAGSGWPVDAASAQERPEPPSAAPPQRAIDPSTQVRGTGNPWQKSTRPSHPETS